MAAIVQSAHNAGTGTSITVTLGTGTTLHNCVVVWVATAASTNGSISGITLGGSAGNFASEATSGSGADHAFAALWTDPDCASGQTSIVITTTGSSGTQSIVAWAWEVSGLPTTRPLLDKSAVLSSAGFVSSWTLGPTATTSQAIEMWFGGVAGNVSGTTPGTYTGPSSPWVNEVNLGVSGASFSFGGVAGSQAVSSTGTASYNGSVTPSSTIQGLIVTLLAAGATNISVSDFAGAVESPAVTATVPVSDSAGQAESLSITATIPMSDVAAMVESQSTVVTLAVSDVAAALDSPAIAVIISVFDVAGEAESPAVNASVPVSDFAGVVEAAAIITGVSVRDFAAQVESVLSVNVSTTGLTALVNVMIASYTSLSSSVTSSFAVGAPYQGNMRELAMDRWNYMYPS